MPRSGTSRPRRPWALVLVTALTAAVALVLPTTGALAARPGSEPAPVTAKIAVAPVTIADLPRAAGTPAVLIDTDVAFSVEVSLVDGVYSTRNDTALVIETSNGVLGGTTQATVPAGSASATFTGLTLEVANGVVLTVRPVDRKAARDLGTGSSDPFDVVTDTELVKVAAGNQPLVVTKSGVPCEPTAEVQTCVDVLLPAGLVTDNVFFSTGSCDGVNCRNPGLDVLQVLADIDGRYSKESPATLVVKCDKSLCGGGAIQRNLLYASLEPTGPLATVPACAAKGVIGADQASCVDYVQSKRDGSGDTYLYWLITRDARMSF